MPLHRCGHRDALRAGIFQTSLSIQHPNFQFIKGDVRNEADVDRALASGVDSIAHLAAIVGDPACSKFSDEAKEVNWTGSVNLFEKAEKAGI